MSGSEKAAGDDVAHPERWGSTRPQHTSILQRTSGPFLPGRVKDHREPPTRGQAAQGACPHSRIAFGVWRRDDSVDPNV